MLPLEGDQNADVALVGNESDTPVLKHRIEFMSDLSLWCGSCGSFSLRETKLPLQNIFRLSLNLVLVQKSEVCFVHVK